MIRYHEKLPYMGAWSFKMNMMKSVFCMFHKFHMKGPRVKAVVDGPTGPAMSGPLFRPSMFSAVSLFGAVCLFVVVVSVVLC